MPDDRKELIAAAAGRLLLRRDGKKLTVTDIVNECHITRQTFYYHFEDIPDLLLWMPSTAPGSMVNCGLPALLPAG